MTQTPWGAALPRHVAIIGLGHIGRIHLKSFRALRERGLIDRIFVRDTDRNRLHALDDVVTLPADAPLPTSVAAALVCVPPHDHASVALPLLERGVAVLIEKPLATSVEQAATLVEIARTHQARLCVGHSERFNTAVRASHHLFTTPPRHIHAQRFSPRAPRHLEIDIILDLMIHDIDLVRALTRDTVVDIQARGTTRHNVLIEVAAELQLSRGTTVHLDTRRYAEQPHRAFTLHYPERETHLDLLAGRGVHRHGEPEAPPQILTLSAQAPDPLTAQLEAFLPWTEDSPALPVAHGDDGLEAIKIARSIREAILSAPRRYSAIDI